MNFKTTFFLAIALLLIMAGLLIVSKSDKKQAERDLATPANDNTQAGLETPLFPGGFGDIEKVSIHQRDGGKWEFNAVASGWELVKPVTAPAANAMVNRLLKIMREMKYTIAYKNGEGITEKETGLKFPNASIQLTNTEGKTFSLRVGSDMNNLSGYVQKEAGGDIYLLSRAVSDLVQKDMGDYRTKTFVSFNPVHVTELSISLNRKGSVTRWILQKTETGWTFTSPFKGEAAARKVNELLQVFSSLDVARWVAQEPESISPFGVEKPAVLLLAVAKEPAHEDSTTTVLKEYELRISALSPLDNNRQVYAMASGSPSIAAIPMNLLHVLLPKMNEWRNMQMLTTPIASANELTLVRPDGSTDMTREGLIWNMSDGSIAATAEINNLLHELGTMQARSFVYEAGDDQAYGFLDPQAKWIINTPRLDQPVTVAIGDYADPRTKRLLYVKVAGVIGKVMASDIKTALWPVDDYKDKTIISLEPDNIRKLDVSKLNPVTDSNLNWTLSRKTEQNAWHVETPESFSCDSSAINMLVDLLADFRAEACVSTDTSPADYGISRPDVRLTVTWLPSSTYRLIEDEASTNGKLVPEEYQPDQRTLTLCAAEKDGIYYAWRKDQAALYRINRDAYEALVSEYFLMRFFEFRTSDVLDVSVTSPDTTDGLTKTGELWQWSAETDIPINDKAIKNYLIRISDLQYQYIVNFESDDTLKPKYTLTVTTTEGSTSLMVSDRVCETMPEKQHYAWMDSRPGVFLVSPNIIRRFELNLAEFE